MGSVPDLGLQARRDLSGVSSFFPRRESLVGERDAIARGIGEHRDQAVSIADLGGVGANREGAAHADRGKERPFDTDWGGDAWVVNALQESGGVTPGSGLNRDRALTGRWNHTFHGKVLADPVLPTHATDSRGGQNDAVERRALGLAQARVDVAADVDDSRVRSQSQDLRIASP